MHHHRAMAQFAQPGLQDGGLGCLTGAVAALEGYEESRHGDRWAQGTEGSDLRAINQDAAAGVASPAG